MVLSQFRQKVNFAQCSIFSHGFFWGWGSGEVGATKLSQNFAESFAEILAKFHELKI